MRMPPMPGDFAPAETDRLSAMATATAADRTGVAGDITNDLSVGAEALKEFDAGWDELVSGHQFILVSPNGQRFGSVAPLIHCRILPRPAASALASEVIS
jgi:hypothetical protein